MLAASPRDTPYSARAVLASNWASAMQIDASDDTALEFDYLGLFTAWRALLLTLLSSPELESYQVVETVQALRFTSPAQVLEAESQDKFGTAMHRANRAVEQTIKEARSFYILFWAAVEDAAGKAVQHLGKRFDAKMF
ncbi:hypothetical protein LTR17_027791 [Elasticomyces elasticus]|nr:hypothetical protein LTR17_027791 [Elasticomyces elasticus]